MKQWFYAQCFVSVIIRNSLSLLVEISGCIESAIKSTLAVIENEESLGDLRTVWEIFTATSSYLVICFK